MLYLMMMRDVALIVHNVRSAYNVGSLLRTADGLGVASVFLTGYTPYPAQPSDTRLPHIATKIDRQIHKTALGAEKSIQWQARQDILQVIKDLRRIGYEVVALEQTRKAQNLHQFRPSGKVAVIVGNEVRGIESVVLDECDKHIEIPMSGQKESFNVAVAGAIAIYHITRFAR